MNGRHPPRESGIDDEADPDEPVLGEVPGEILELAESCRRFAFAAVRVELDYEPETLPILDQYLGLARGGVSDRPELGPLVERAAAAYFGEVARRRFDAFWLRRADATDGFRLCARRAFFWFSPLGQVMESMAHGEERPGPPAEFGLAPDDREVAHERLARLPPVSEDEYHLLSTRLEVLEVVHETLVEKMKAEGREGIVFEAADYEGE